MKKRFFAYSFVMTLMLLGAMYGHLHTGFSDMSTSDLIRILFGGGNDVEKLTVFDFRLVRTILAVFIGMGLAMSGAIFQTISRNELASPSLLGVNAGAGLGVVLLVYFAGSTTAWGIWTLPTVAVAGAVVAAILIYLLSCRGRDIISPYRLILTGISMSAGLHALQVLLVTRLDPNKFYLVNTWTIGTISGNTWEHVWVLVEVFAITVFQRFALFASTWFVYKAFGLSGSSAFVIIILQGTISVAVDMLPLPGGMGISEQLFLRIFLPIFGSYCFRECS